jgi:hypothetical protein
MKNNQRALFAFAPLICAISLACLGVVSCGGGSDNSGSSASQSGAGLSQGTGTSTPSDPGVDFTLSSTFANADNATFAGGFTGVVSASRAGPSSTAPPTWQLVPNVGSLSAQRGDSITYTPPAPSALEVPTNVAVQAKIGQYQHSANIALYPATWKLPAGTPNYGSLSVSGSAKPASFPSALTPNDYPQNDPIPNFDMYSWMVLPTSLQATGPDNLMPGNYIATAGKGTFIGVQLQTFGIWQVTVRVVDDPNSTTPTYSGQTTCEACTGMSVAVNGSNMVFTNVQVPLDQGGAIVLNGALAIGDGQRAQAGTTVTAADLQQCPKTWASETGTAAVASLSCVNGTYRGTNPSGSGQCTVVIDTAANSVSFTSDGTTETMPIPDNATTGTVTLGYNPFDYSGYTAYPFHDQYAVALNTQPQAGGGASVQRMLFTFGFQESQSTGVSDSRYELNFAYTKAGSATSNPSVAKYCRIKLPT